MTPAFNTNDFTIDTTQADQTDQLLSLCTHNCFAGGSSYSTVPFYAAGAPRSLTLMYTEERAHPRPMINADVHPTTGSAAPSYKLQATLNGTSVTFLTGSTTLTLANIFGDSVSVIRLASQFDARNYTTGVYTLVVTVTATFPHGSPLSVTHTYTRSLVIDNEAHSPIARGWAVAGVQHLYISGSSYMITDGTGDAVRFSALGATAVDYTTLTYNGTTHVYTRSYLDGRKVLFTSTGLDSLDIDRLGNTTSYGYDGTGRLSWVKDPVRTGGFGSPPYLSLSYGTYGLSGISETGGAGTARATTVSVASDSTLRTFTDPDGVSSSMTYDASGRLSTITDRRGGVTTYQYHPHSWKLSEVDFPQVAADAGSGTTVNVIPKVKYSPWQSVLWTYDSLGLALEADVWILNQVTDPIGRVTTITPDRWGQPLQIVDPANQTTTITRNGMLPVKVVYPTGGIDTMTYATGTPLLTFLQTAGDSVVHYHYGAQNQADSIWGAGLRSQRLFLDATTGRIDSIRYAGTNTLMARYTYDAHNRLLTATDPGTHTVTYAYDTTWANVDSVSRLGNLFTVTHFDAYGRDSTTRTSGSSLTQLVLYDQLNRVVKTWHAGLPGGYAPDTAVIKYDSLFPVRIQSGGGQVYKVAYNALGWTTQSFDSKDTTLYVSYRYDTAGRNTSVTNRRGQRISMTYDILDRVLTRTISGTYADTFSYSTNGLIAVATRKNVSRDSIFTKLNGATDSLVRGIAGYRYALGYSYGSPGMANYIYNWIHTNSGITFDLGFQSYHDTMPALDSVFVGNGSSNYGGGYSTILRNKDGLTSTVHLVGPGSIEQTYYTAQHQIYFRDLSSFSTPTLRDSLARAITYDSLGRVVADHRLTVNGRVLGHSIVYDSLGRLLFVRSTVDSACTSSVDTLALGYVYNCVAHLSSVTQDSATYDGSGNRLFVGATYSTQGNRLLTGPSGVSYTYDADGNVVTRTHGGVVDSLFWSAIGLLDSVASGGSTGLRHMYEYNSFGQLVRRQTKVGAGAYSVDRYFLWDGDQLIAELAYPGTHRIAGYAYYDGVDQPFAIFTDTTFAGTSNRLTRYFYQDPTEGNLTAILRDSLTMHQYTQYSAWGQQLARPINRMADTNRLGWKGLLYEGDSTRLYYMRGRWYDPAVGRFISEDPIGIAGGLNLYVFSHNDPINRSDPSGTCDYYTHYYQNGEEIAGFPGSIGPGQSYTYFDAAGFMHTSWCGCDNNTWSDLPVNCSPPPSQPSMGGGEGGSGANAPPAGPPAKPPEPKCPLRAPSGNYTVGSNAVALFQSPMAAALSSAFQSLNSRGVTPMITSGFRAAADQLRMRQGGSGSNPAATVSWHQVGMAVDFNTKDGNFPELQAAMLAQGLTWGGTFRKPDLVHFQLSAAGTRPGAAMVKACGGR